MPIRLTLLGLIKSLIQHRELIAQLSKREITGRYRGSVLGLFWSFLHPVLLLSIYTFVFSMVFKVRWGQHNDDQVTFALILFSGLMLFNFFSECLSQAPNLIVKEVNFVKKVIFPLEILPLVQISTSLFHWAINFFVLLIAMIFKGIAPDINWLYLPAIWLPFILFTLGLEFLLASLGVFLRDINQVINMVLTTLMFLSPIFYPISNLPADLQPVLIFNPLTLPIEQTRSALLFSTPPDYWYLAVYFVISLLCLQLGYFWFQKTRKGFADVL